MASDKIIVLFITWDMYILEFLSEWAYIWWSEWDWELLIIIIIIIIIMI